MQLNEPSANAFRCYLRWFGATVLLACFAIASLVMLVDPYRLYHHAFERPGFNLIKPGLGRYQDEIKLSHVIALAPDVLILGNSRAEIGFDPDGHALAGTSAYNLAIAGTAIGTARLQLEQLERIGLRPKLVVLGLEFLDFINAPSARSGAIVAMTASLPLPTTPATHPIERRFWRFDSVFSMAALQDALRTVSIQRDADSQTMTARGFNPLNEYRALARTEGYYRLFRQRAEENATTYVRKAHGSVDVGDFAHLDAILALAARSHIELKLVIYPYHAQTLVLFEASGLWPAFEQWKQHVATQAAAARQRDPSARIALVDFSGYSSIACERIPAPADLSSVTRWYWEGGHFKKTLGEAMLANLLPSNTARKPQANRFGFPLEPGNAGANAHRIGRERARCLRDYPALFDESASLVALARASSIKIGRQ